MSLKTWKKEFYPTTAKTAASRNDTIECIEHSIQKWKGALPENAEKHGVKYQFHEIKDELNGVMFRFNGDSCALCVKYYNKKSFDSCAKCPLVVAGFPPCDSSDDEVFDPFKESLEHPRKMIEALEKTLEQFKEMK